MKYYSLSGVNTPSTAGISYSKILGESLINIAKGLNIEVIITGIENQQQLDNFASLRADGYQGYISAPEDIL